MEQTAIYARFDPALNWNIRTLGPANWWSSGANVAAAFNQIKTFQCPSDNVTSAGSGTFDIAIVDLWWDGGSNLNAQPVGFGNQPQLGKTNYLGVSGYFGYTTASTDVYEGIFTNRSGTKLNAISDGTSNTLMFGETLGRELTGSPTTTQCWISGPLPTAWGLPTSGSTGWWHFSSRHTGVVNFAMGDASVRGLRSGFSSGSQQTLFLYYSGIREGGIVDPNAL